MEMKCLTNYIDKHFLGFLCDNMTAISSYVE